MSDTTGWEPDGMGGFCKYINGNLWASWLGPTEWCLRWRGNTLATRPTLRECQILAHDTARLWAGESE